MNINWVSMDILLMNCFNNAVSNNPQFPVAPQFGGNLKNNASYVEVGGGEWKIIFDDSIAHYIPYLEYGTQPHLIPNAFGRGITVLHPGSQKHKKFIENMVVNEVLRTVYQSFPKSYNTKWVW